jgi:hypothetical protein
MDVFQYTIDWSKRGKKGKYYASINDDVLELKEFHQTVLIEDIIEIIVKTKVTRKNVSGTFVHRWFVKTKTREYHVVDGFETRNKVLKRLLFMLKERNPNIYINDRVESFLNQKVYDRTPRKNMFTADIMASFRNPRLDTLLGLGAVFFMILFISVVSVLMKQSTLGLFGINEDYRIMFTLFGSLILSLAVINEGIAPFVGSYLGIKPSIILGLIGCALLIIAL